MAANAARLGFGVSMLTAVTVGAVVNVRFFCFAVLLFGQPSTFRLTTSVSSTLQLVMLEGVDLAKKQEAIRAQLPAHLQPCFADWEPLIRQIFFLVELMHVRNACCHVCCLLFVHVFLSQEKGVYHRDLKPQNIVVLPDGKIYFSQFCAVLVWLIFILLFY